ncbi:hypothetical protein FACS1894196_0010 [Clostridia bacterium]|nr:hypothetical protein FACS1894196_0010 [Clostridia bacterium]
MKITFNGYQGTERKPLVKAIEELTGRKGKYCMNGDMKYAYDFGGGLALHRDGTLIDEGNIFGLLTGLAERGFVGTAEEEPAHDEAAWHDECDAPDDENDPDIDYAYEERMAAEIAEQIADAPETESDQLVIEMPLTGFTPEKLDNLAKLVAAKTPLLKAALGAEDLPIQQVGEDGGKLRFPWFNFGDTTAYDYGDKTKAYATLIEKICVATKEKRRVTAKECDVENPKYAMRCWLLSLGFIGDEYKVSRKILLANLGGSSSFKGGSRPTYTAHCYTYPNGSEEDAMDCETFEFTSLAKAKACCDEFLADCESLKFAGAHVEDDNGAYLYEILLGGAVETK